MHTKHVNKQCTQTLAFLSVITSHANKPCTQTMHCKPCTQPIHTNLSFFVCFPHFLLMPPAPTPTAVPALAVPASAPAPFTRLPIFFPMVVPVLGRRSVLLLLSRFLVIWSLRFEGRGWYRFQWCGIRGWFGWFHCCRYRWFVILKRENKCRICRQTLSYCLFGFCLISHCHKTVGEGSRQKSKQNR